MRIVLVASLPPPPGGISTWTEGLVHFASRDSHLELVHVDSAVRFRSAVNLGLASRLIGGFFHAAILFARFSAALLVKRVDAVHICISSILGLLRDLLMAGFARLLRVPVVIHIHNGRLPGMAKSGNNWKIALIKTACRLATRVIVLDTASAETLRALVLDCPVTVIQNPAWKFAEISATPVHCEETKVIAFVGRVIPAKGIRELVLACRDIKETMFRLDIIGPVDEEFKNEIQSLARSREDGKWLTMPGQIENHDALARIASAFAVVLPSYTEGCPYLLLEAMMLGKPVIATPVGAIPQMLAYGTPESCGILVPARDADALRVAIQSLLSEPGRARQLGRRGREQVEREYSPAAAYSRYRSIWESAIL